MRTVAHLMSSGYKTGGRDDSFIDYKATKKYPKRIFLTRVF